MRRFALAVVLLAACSKKGNTGLAPAQDWNAQQPGIQAAGNPGPAPMENPHTADPSNPHAGLGLNAEGQPEGDPSAAGGGVDVTKLGLQSPDPGRQIDPSRFVRGVITADPKAADHLKPGGVIFVVVKRADASGQPTGTPLAVDKLTWQKDELPFELGEAQAMVAGTELSGDVIVSAHFAQNGDALSRAPGDLTGQTRVTIPADHVKVVLDQVLN